MNRKSLGAVVATALLIIVSVLAVIGFQTWFQTYSSSIFTSAEHNNILSVNFEKEVGDTLYLKSNKISSFDYLSVSSMNGTKTCEISKDSINNLNSNTVLLLDIDHKNSTHIFDLSGYGNDAKIYDAICNKSINGISGIGCYFDGDLDYLDSGNDESLNFNSSFSIGGWFNPYIWNNDICGRIIINKYNYESGNRYGFYYGMPCSNEVGFRSTIHLETNVIGSLYDDITEDLNQWIFFAAVFDSNKSYKTYIYKNNKLEIYNDDTEIYSNFVPSNENLRIGMRSQNNQGSFEGIIDELFIYNKTINDDDMRYIIEQKKAIKYEQLITKGISSIDLSSCNLNKGEQYNLLILGDNVNIQQTFIAQ